MADLALTPARSNLLWRALWTELDRLENHPDNVPYRTGREAILTEMREISAMLRAINDDAAIVKTETFEEMLRHYLFTSPFTDA